ncbi:hypothetical protein BDW68DRAFT_186456 [Aspergillus falconensis]
MDLLLDGKSSPQAFPAYFALYQSVFCQPNRQKYIQHHYPAVTSHTDVLECAKSLRLNPASTREELANTLSSTGPVPQMVKDDAVRAIIRAVSMVNCSLEGSCSKGFKVGNYSSTQGEASESFVSYKLGKRYQLQFRPTDSITEHLLYDPLTRTVHVFHHTAYVEAHLGRSKDQPIDQQGETLKLGTLPLQLLLESLHTIHFILLPTNLDLDAKLVEYFRDIPANSKYVYRNARLEQLYNVVKNPPLRNRFASWVERHTSERNALAVTIIGLFLSALFGFIACVIGVAQLAISVLAWKRPKEPS